MLVYYFNSLVYSLVITKYQTTILNYLPNYNTKVQSTKLRTKKCFLYQTTIPNTEIMILCGTKPIYTKYQNTIPKNEFGYIIWYLFIHSVPLE